MVTFNAPRTDDQSQIVEKSGV